MFCCCFVWGSDNFIQKQQGNDYGRVLSCLVCLTNGRIRVKHARAATPLVPSNFLRRAFLPRMLRSVPISPQSPQHLKILF
jgi:hypothetical protein